MRTFNGRECYPLTYAQRMNWDYEQNFIRDPSLGAGGRDVIGGYLRIHGDVDFEIFKKAINIFVKKHDSMRIHYIEENGEPWQYISEYKEFKVDCYDFSNEKKPEEQFNFWLDYTFNKGFDLLESNLFYFAVVRIKKDLCALVAKLHHLNADGWSAALFAMETSDIYTKIKNGKPVEEEVDSSYFDYVKDELLYMHSDKSLEEREFWRNMLQGFPEQSFAVLPGSMTCGKKEFLLSKDLSEDVKAYCRTSGVSLTKLFMSVMALYTYSNSGQKDMLFGTYTHNRLGKRKSFVGNCISALPVRIKIEDSACLAEFVNKVSSIYTTCIRYRKYPLALLAKDMRLNEKGYRNFFQTAVNCYVYPDIIVDGLKTDFIGAHFGRAPIAPTLAFQLEVIEQMGKENLLFVFMYRTSYYSQEQIEGIYEDICKIIDKLLKEHEIEVSKLIS